MSDLCVGVDVAEPRRGFDLVAVDKERRIVVVHPQLSIADASALIVRELKPAVVCIDSPAQWSTSGNSRLAERQLRAIGIGAFRTPREEQAVRFHAWMRCGFALYEALAAAYPRYRGGSVRGTAAEYFPHASAVLLAGRIGRYADKHAFRRRILEEQGVSTGSLRSLDQVDAALGALTGCIALCGAHAWVGDCEEGALLLPVAALPARLHREVGRPVINDTAAETSADPPLLRRALPRGVSAPTCACGCGAPVRREFRPGHDAKLLSQLRRAAATGRAADAELRRRGWE